MPQRPPSVLLVSIDALMPEFVLRPGASGPRLPNLRALAADGARAGAGVQSVFPSFTYPCHQSIITGTHPLTHGTCNNLLFDPEGARKGAWHWFATGRVPTLWQLAREHGYRSASVLFPTALGAPADVVVPEFWWDGSGLDQAFLDQLGRPQGLVREMARDGVPCPGGMDLTLDADRRRKACASWVLAHHLRPALGERPFFLTAYLGAYDEAAHQHGVRSAEAMAVLEGLDALLGELVQEAREATGGDLLVAVASDHGTLDNTCCIKPNVRLREAGLISLDQRQRVTGWKAWCQRAGGTAEIRLRDAFDAGTRLRVRDLLEELKADPASGVLDWLDGHQARRERRGFAEADFVIIARKGHEIRDEADGAYLDPVPAQAAQHGYDETFEEMRAWFSLTGPGVPAGLDLGPMDLVDIAPTLAARMGFPMPTAEGVDRMG